MRFYKNTDNGYILTIGTGLGGTEITEAEYNQILNIIHNKPQRTETTDYRLKEDLTWEEYEVPPMPEPELDDSEALSIILGGAE